MNKKEINAIKCLEVDMLDNKQIEIILNLIEKQQKELKKIKKKNKSYEKIIIEAIDKTHEGEKQLMFLIHNCISKDKIREKIKELDKMISKVEKEENILGNEFMGKHFYYIEMNKILNELLEEE